MCPHFFFDQFTIASLCACTCYGRKRMWQDESDVVRQSQYSHQHEESCSHDAPIPDGMALCHTGPHLVALDEVTFDPREDLGMDYRPPFKYRGRI